MAKPAKQQLQVKVYGKKYNYQGHKDQQETDFFEMLYKVRKKEEPPTEEELKDLWAENAFSNDTPGSELLERYRAEEKRQVKRRERKARKKQQDAEANDDDDSMSVPDGATPQRRGGDARDGHRDPCGTMSSADSLAIPVLKVPARDARHGRTRSAESYEEMSLGRQGSAPRVGGPRASLHAPGGRHQRTRTAAETRELDNFIDEVLNSSGLCAASAARAVGEDCPGLAPSRSGRSSLGCNGRTPARHQRTLSDTEGGGGTRGRSSVASQNSPPGSGRGSDPNTPQTHTPRTGLSPGSDVRKLKVQTEGSDMLKAISLKGVPEGMFAELLKTVQQKCAGASVLWFRDADGDRIEVEDDESLDMFFEELDRKVEIGEKLVLQCCSLVASGLQSPGMQGCALFGRQPKAIALEAGDGGAASTDSSRGGQTASQLEADKDAIEAKGKFPHSSPVYCCAFSPHGDRLLTGCRDPVFHMWDMSDQSKLNTFRHCDNERSFVLALDYSRDEKYVVSGGSDRNCRIHFADTAKKKCTLRGHSEKVYSVAFSQDSKYIASASNDKSVKVWNVDSGKKVENLSGHTSYVFSVCWSPDRKAPSTLCSSGDDKTILFWDWTAKKAENRLKGTISTSSACWSVQFSPGAEEVIAAVGNDLTLYNVAQRRPVWSVKEAHDDNVHRSVFVAAGDMILSCSRDKYIKLWCAKTGDPLGKFLSHTEWIFGLAVAGNTVVSVSNDHTAVAWSLAEMERVVSSRQGAASAWEVQ